MEKINKSVKELINEGIKNLKSANYKEALEKLKEAEMLDRNNPEIFYNLGIAYTRLGLYKTAEDYFKKIISLNTGFIDSKLVKKNLAFCYINSERYDEALSLLDEILKQYPDDITSLNMKGYALEKTGKIKESIAIYSLIIRNNKKNLNSMNSAAYLMAKNGGDLDSALKLANYVHLMDNKNPAYKDTLGYIYMKKGDLKKAEDLFFEAYRDIPFNKELQEHIMELKELKMKSTFKR
ncbi:MAG TPA: tetratricopeptide repeat protein [Spirochaetota bacterium]|jgi:tetratricopeptide (TPR) repeat protein|nr:tetratricopeptide repeat protein [Spirochaetota bacterium]HPD77310.1 tetratricopeptide repeat protein [Spirochaetota bacterium]HPP94903.1 tetratricopeptide repeat protein [Spirochaetota bacterium]HPX90843.1 tetratricopeptide repeat protein [Spirochaetota bacterium]